MNNPLVTLDNGPRPFGNEDECFYCKQKLGEYHTDECPFVTKIIKVRFTLDLDIEVPRCWDNEMVDFYYNESSWCADNIDILIKDHKKLNGLSCVCDTCSMEILK